MSNGHIMQEQHRCVPPKILKRYGSGTEWSCHGCGKTWQIIWLWGKPEWRTFEFCKNLNTFHNFKPKWNDWIMGRQRPDKPYWNEEKQE